MNQKTKNILISLITIGVTAAFVIAGVDIFAKQIEANKPIVPPKTSVTESGGESSTPESSSDTGSDASSSSPDTDKSSSSAVSSENSKAESGSAPSSQPPQNTAGKDIPEGFFNNSLFIGDSRTVGLRDYGGISGASFFSTVGMNVYKIKKETVNVSGVGSVTLEQLLKARQYGKIYIMLGINELGYKLGSTMKKYSALVDEIKRLQPEAKIILQANLHITQKRSAKDKVYNNANINAFNAGLERLADGKTVYYIDVNPLFDDASGSLDPKYTSDNTHILGKYYRDWARWICENSQL